jgi:hypothetical protein
MKGTLLTFLLLLATVFASEAKPKNYYWVVESTTCLQGSSVIRIYNEQHELVYTEKVEGQVLDTSDKRVAEHLNRKARKLKKLSKDCYL